MYSAHSPLATSSVPEPSSTPPSNGTTYRQTSATTPAPISASPAACVPRGTPSPRAAISADTNSGTMPGTIAPTNDAEVSDPPNIAARKNGTPAPHTIFAAGPGRTAASARRRRHSAGARTTSGTPKRSSAASAGSSVDALSARALSAKAAQISTVSSSAAVPAAPGDGPRGSTPRPAAGAPTVFVATTTPSTPDEFDPSTATLGPGPGQPIASSALQAYVRGRICQGRWM
ncbi:hypothetical protein [Streptomyces somaliensis]|uniref:hypothetical protein n=1 Tax=Streptomyces somaliensis TaxID=78355 RepID=UPI0034E9352F|nr:hypothetical protein [Streptomyces somaliensis]